MKNIFNSHNSMQYLATFSGAFSVISNGINQAWTSPYLPKLLDENSDIPTTSDEGAWCAIMAVVGAPFGAIFAASVVNRIGRKNTILLLSPIIFFSFLTIAFAKTISVISIARFFISASEGGLYTVLPIYIAEISNPNIRGFLTSLIDIASIFGGLLVNAIGPFTSIFVSSLIWNSFVIIHLMTFIWVPESPYYLIKKKKFEEAKKTLVDLRGTKDVEQELSELCEAVSRQESNKKSRVIDLVLVKSNRKAAVIFMILAVTKQFSGHNPFLFYTTTIFESAKTNIDSTLSVILYCVARLVSQTCALMVIDKFGRRILFTSSAAGCALFLFCEGLYFYLQSLDSPVLPYLNWLPITALLGYIIVFSCGISYAPVLLLGELFPTNIKAVALALGDTFSATMGAISSKYFQMTMDTAGMYVPFWSFAVSSFIGLCLIAKFIPETKGKTLEEIQLYLINKK